MLARGQAGDACSQSNAAPCLRVIKLESFARDYMQLRGCL